MGMYVIYICMRMYVILYMCAYVYVYIRIQLGGVSLVALRTTRNTLQRTATHR